ncbi:MAG: hypothetical protein AAF761_11320 [Pseudomonadota bacterium]
MALKPGDLCSLISGSPRMAVLAVNAEGVDVLWCNEGVVYRDTFPPFVLRVWEVRDGDDRGPKPFRGDRDGGSKPFHKGGDRDGGKPFNKGGDRGKSGWDGKPRQKTHYRKD